MKLMSAAEETPWWRWQEIGMGIMGMSPIEFWSQSHSEWAARLEGFLEFHGSGNPAPMSRSELDDLMKRYPDKK